MLELSNIILGYENKAVLELAGLKLEQGKQLLIVGASGSGKTTLLYSIAGLIEVMKGNIIINGSDITKFSETARDNFRGKNIGMIFQTLHLVKSLTVMDNLLLASYVAGFTQDKDEIHKILADLNIAEKADSLPEALSQGQAQRVAIARAILHKPALILADEPTSSLDDESCNAVISLIMKTAEEVNATLIISTHDSRVKTRFANILNLEDR